MELFRLQCYIVHFPNARSISATAGTKNSPSRHTKARLGRLFFHFRKFSWKQYIFPVNQLRSNTLKNVHFDPSFDPNALDDLRLAGQVHLKKAYVLVFTQPAQYSQKINVFDRQMFLPCAFWRTVPLSPIFEPIRHLRRSKPSSFWQFSFFPRTGIGVMIIPLSQNLSWLFLKTAMEIGAFLV